MTTFTIDWRSAAVHLVFDSSPADIWLLLKLTLVSGRWMLPPGKRLLPEWMNRGRKAPWKCSTTLFKTQRIRTYFMWLCHLISGDWNKYHGQLLSMKILVHCYQSTWKRCQLSKFSTASTLRMALNSLPMVNIFWSRSAPTGRYRKCPCKVFEMSLMALSGPLLITSSTPRTRESRRKPLQPTFLENRTTSGSTMETFSLESQLPEQRDQPLLITCQRFPCFEVLSLGSATLLTLALITSGTIGTLIQEWKKWHSTLFLVRVFLIVLNFYDFTLFQATSCTKQHQKRPRSWYWTERQEQWKELWEVNRLPSSARPSLRIQLVTYSLEVSETDSWDGSKPRMSCLVKNLSGVLN